MAVLPSMPGLNTLLIAAKRAEVTDVECGRKDGRSARPKLVGLTSVSHWSGAAVDLRLPGRAERRGTERSARSGQHHGCRRHDNGFRTRKSHYQLCSCPCVAGIDLPVPSR
jgi:hypothetical protein